MREMKEKDNANNNSNSNDNKYYKIECYKCGKISYFNSNDEFCGNREGGIYYYIICPNCGQSICVYIKYPYGCMNYRKDFLK